MGANLEQARNELIVLFTQAWQAEAAKLELPVMQSLTIGFFDPDGVPNEGANRANKPWARLTVQHTESRRPLSAKRVTRNGIVTLQTFHYRSVTNADAMAQRLGGAVASAVERHRGAVTLMGITPLERPINNGYAQTDVQARFMYTEHLR